MNAVGCPDPLPLTGAKWAAKSEAYATFVSEHLSANSLWLDAGCGNRLLETDLDPLETWLAARCKNIVGMDVLVTSHRNIKSLVQGSLYHLPFADNQFDLITNRHGYYYEPEIQRILKPGHQLITQQVGGRTMEQLNSVFGVPYTYADWSLEKAVTQLQAAGLQIVEQREEFSIERFYDVGAIAYYLKIVPWQIPGFSVEKYFDKLVTLHEMIQADGYFEDHFHAFFIIAQKRKLP